MFKQFICRILLKMISKEQLEKFTVLQLKDKLKSRKLVTSGAKPDLITRLYNNMLEESLLDMNGGDNDSAGPSEFDLSNVDVDEVLNMESDLLTTTVNYHDEKLANIDGESLSSIPIEEAKAKKVHAEVNDNNSLIKASNTATTLPSKKTAITLSTTAEVSNTTPTKEKIDSGEESPKNGTVTDAKKTKGLSTAESQKMLLISRKLGLPCKDSNSNTEDPLAKRARRFGPISEEIDKKQSHAERFGLTTTAADGKKQKRTERFGLVSDTLYDKKKQRAERFDKGSSASNASDEKLQKRAERFRTATEN